MTNREAIFVFPFLNTIAQHKELSSSRKAFILPFLAKVKAVIDQANIIQENLIIKYGERYGDLEKFRLKTKNQVASFKAEMKLYRDLDVDLKLTKDEQTLFDILYYQSIISGYEDYPEI